MAKQKASDETPKDLFKGLQPERVQELDDHEPVDGRYVLYWMQQSVRAELNHALEYAIDRANQLGLPLLVAFGLTDDYPEANLRHYHFLVQGLADVESALGRRSIPFVVRRGRPDEVALELADDAALVVCDRGYLRQQRRWREHVAEQAPCPVVQVESDVVVPVELASDQLETAARTLRPKLTAHLERFLVPVRRTTLKDTTSPRVGGGEDLSDVDALLARMDLDTSVPPVPMFTGGTTAAKKVLKAFVKNSLPRYAEHRNQPQTDDVSHMSKYLHYGHISPIAVALEIRKAPGGENSEAYLEELIVRRELPMNYVFYERDYDKYSALPEWARTTLDEHRDDPREHTYTRGQLEQGETHDPYFNAAMKELRETGYMHNYMRMYWGKKIIEWSKRPETAYRTTLALNNTYFLDGRDANSYANVAWLFGRHDRGWTERDVLGKVRWMSADGLERKADPQAYVEKVDRLVADLDA